MSKMKYFLSACLFVLMHPAYCQSYLPPVKPWKGTSENLLRSTKDPLVTPFELSGGKNSATALELYDWFSVLMHTYPEVQRESIGTTAQNRNIWMYSIRRAGESKPVFLFQAGIHAGEIDGKDAGMLVFRELLEQQSSLLDQVNVLFIPILNVDGHERASRFNRINQRGPSVMGWRSNSLNQNLNRDYTKLDTKEIQAVVQVINRENPALYMDIHVTDGADYQYDITYGFQGEHAYSPSISNWMKTQFKPQADRALKTNGHIPGPLLFAVNDEDFKDGNNEFTFSPRFSHGYGDARHLPTILVENHSLKPFHQRVLGTCVLLMETLRILEKHGAPLLLAMEKDQNRLPSSLPLSWDVSSSATDSMIFEGIASKKIQSKVTGQNFVEWLGEPEKQIIAVRKNNQVVQQMNRPKHYVIPVQYHEVIEGLKKHGIELKVLQSDSAITVSMYRLSNAQIQGKLPNQGRCRLKADVKEEQRSIVFPKGSVRIETNQPLGDLAILLLEPEFTDSYFQWGFFPECLERTEYFEEYVLEPYAAEQLQKDPVLTAAFESKKAHDEVFAKDQQAQLRWFYERSPFADETYLLYPVGRILN